MKNLHILIILLTIQCTSNRKYRLVDQVYQNKMSTIIFREDSMFFAGNPFDVQNRNFPYEIKDDLLFVVSSTKVSRIVLFKFLIRGDQLVIPERPGSLYVDAGLEDNSEITFSRLPEKEGKLYVKRYLNRQVLGKEIQSWLAAKIKSGLDNPDNFEMAGYFISPIDDPIKEFIDDLEIKIRWWNQQTGDISKWTWTIFHIRIEGNQWIILNQSTKPA